MNPEWRPTRPFVFDTVVMLACVALDFVFTVFALEPQRFGTDIVTATVLLWALQLAADVSLVVRRRLPLLTLGFAVLAAGPVLVAALGTIPAPAPEHAEPWIPASIPIAAYSTVVYARHRVMAWTLVGVLAVLVAQPWRLSWFTVVTGGLLVLVPALLGLYVAARRRLIDALTERAERAEHERLLLAEQARAEERLRLASDMHDVVSHRVSLMVLQAGALRMTASDEATRTAAEELRSAGGLALDELRDLIGVLRTTPPDEPVERAAAVVALPDLTELAGQSRAVGVPVELNIDGEPYPVTAAAGRTVYRVVQEGLTNVRKYAPGAATDVGIVYDEAELRVRVRNGAPVAPPDPALVDSGSRTGLAGLRQRVELLGGRLSTETHGCGGFTVIASLPRHGATTTEGRQ